MENGIKHMEIYLSAITFLVAASLTLYQTNIYLDALIMNKSALSGNVMYEQHYEVETDLITYTELVASLFYDLEYDIQINSQLISRHDHLDIHLANYEIPNTMYVRSYAYDNNGNITRVIYTSENII